MTRQMNVIKLNSSLADLEASETTTGVRVIVMREV